MNQPTNLFVEGESKNRYTGMMPPKPTIVIDDRVHLLRVINDEMRAHGNHCSLNHLDVSGVESMFEVFKNSEFDGDIAQWDVSRVDDMGGMFENSQFTGDISRWCVANVASMRQMFNSASFNGNLTEWDTSGVYDFSGIFANAVFAQDVSRWTIRVEADTHGLHMNNPYFQEAQSMSAWVVALYIENNQMPLDHLWKEAFAKTEPIAKSLALDSSEHAHAVMATYTGLLNQSRDGYAFNVPVDGEIFEDASRRE